MSILIEEVEPVSRRFDIEINRRISEEELVNLLHALGKTNFRYWGDTYAELLDYCKDNDITVNGS